jgi:hypothetical protein
MVSKGNIQFDELYAEADCAGLAAVRELIARWARNDSRVVGLDPLASIYIPGEGCGFASIIVNGNSPFGRWAKRCKGWERQHPSGVGVSVARFGQSENRKTVYGRAFAEVLRRSGIDARCESRSD